MTSQVPNYHGYRFPPEIISHAIWLYQRFDLSFRDVDDPLAQRDITVTYETIRLWCQRFGPVYAGRLRRRRGRMGDIWTSRSSPFRVASSTCGAQWMRTATSSTSWCSRGEIGRPPFASFAS